MMRSNRGRRSSRPSRAPWAPAALAILSAALIAQPAAANQDCSIGRDGWDDIQRFRRCLEEYHPDRWGDPWLLHRASGLTSNPTIVRLLLQEGWDPNAPDDDGLTPLHWGAENSNPTVVSHLLDAGAELNARDNEGYTALHWAAAQSGNGRVVKVLLDRGANPFAESNDGRTPLHSALRYRAETLIPGRTLTGSLSSSDAVWGDGSHYDNLARHRPSGGTACSHRYGLGRRGRLPPGPAPRPHGDRDRG